MSSLPWTSLHHSRNYRESQTDWSREHQAGEGNSAFLQALMATVRDAKPPRDMAKGSGPMRFHVSQSNSLVASLEGDLTALGGCPRITSVYLKWAV